MIFLFVCLNLSTFIVLIWFLVGFLPHHAASGILVPWPGTELTPLALEVETLSHWAAREVPLLLLFFLHMYVPGDTCVLSFTKQPYARSVSCPHTKAKGWILLLCSFTKGTEAQKGWVTCLRSHSGNVAKPEGGPEELEPRVSLLSLCTPDC